MMVHRYDDRFSALFDGNVDPSIVYRGITRKEWCPVKHVLEDDILYLPPVDELVKHAYGRRVLDVVSMVGAEFICRHEQPEPLRTIDPVGFIKLPEVQGRLKFLKKYVRSAFVKNFLEDCCMNAASSNIVIFRSQKGPKGSPGFRSYSSEALMDMAEDLAKEMYRLLRNRNGSE